MTTETPDLPVEVPQSESLLRALMGVEEAAPLTSDERRDAARTLFADLSLDTASFYGRYGVTVSAVIDAVRVRIRSAGADDGLAGWRGAALVVAASVELSARLSSDGILPSDAEYAQLTNDLSLDAVVPTIRDLYGLYQSDGSGVTATDAALASVDWTSLEVHRVGTTSIILKAESTPPGSRDRVLKLVHFLFQGVEPIRDATSRYCARAEAVRKRCAHVAEVYASGDGWVLEEFIFGPTLIEHIHEERNAGKLDHLALLHDVYVPLVRAVASLHEDGDAVHGDLNPSNVLLQTSGVPGELAGKPGEHGKVVIRFVDIGRNLLASDVIGRVRSPDAHFVAPEVARLDPDVDIEGFVADYYSLGLLLPVCLGVIEPSDLAGGSIPEELFVTEPLLARVMADLADPRADARLSLLGTEVGGSTTSLAAVADYLDQAPELPHRGAKARPSRKPSAPSRPRLLCCRHRSGGRHPESC